MKPLAQRMALLENSLTVAMTAKAQKMKAQGEDVVSLSAGEPDFPTPAFIRQAACAAIEAGYTKYAPPAGYPELLGAISEKFLKDNGLSYSSAEIVVSSGAKHSIYNAIMALCQSGDEALIPSPYWVTYPALVKLAQAVPVIVPALPENGFKVTVKDLEKRVSPKTKLLILNSPCNPTGAVYTPEETAALADFAVRHDLYVVSDEVYEKIIYGQARHVSPASLGKEIRERCITVNGVSKAFSMTGWRIGYAAGPEPIIRQMVKFQGQTAHHPCTVAMKASEAALRSDGACVAEMTQAFRERRDWMLERLKKISGIVCSPPQGAFYLFPDVSCYFGRKTKTRMLNNSLDLCDYLLDEWKLALVPGEGFGEPRCLRISYAANRKVLEQGMERFEKGLQNLS